MLERVEGIIMQIDPRIRGEIDVGLHRTSSTDPLACILCETLYTSELRYRPQLPCAEIAETNGLIKPRKLISSKVERDQMGEDT